MISEPVLRALNDMGFEEPTPIQQEAIPVAMSGKDMIGQAQTGTGKTAAFGLPVLERVDGNERHVQVVILSPTRELAIQVAEELNKMAQYTNITALPIYGGQDINRQFRALKKNPQIIVATPGRLMDHMDRGSIKFDHVKVVVLDEADEMLNMGFVDDINKILGAIPEDHQTLLFSATMPKAIRELAETYLTEPTLIRMKPTQVTMDLIEQYYIEVQDRQKFDVLCRLFDLQAPELAIIFTRTKRRVDEVTEALKKRGYMAEGIHGDLSQQKRDSVIRQFREGTIDILVNNAGIIRRVPMHEMDAADFRRVIDIDLNAPFIVAKAVLPAMMEKRAGKIINICSMMSELGRETVSAYAAAKGGLKMLTRNICSEYGEYNIQCNGIGPGYIATPQTAPLREPQADGSRHPFDSFICAKTPAGRWLDPEELTGPAVFLASEASNAVNGHILYVDGGILAYIGKQPK